jgi:glycosyltransferase involved in cell wall biosynthesis
MKNQQPIILGARPGLSVDPKSEDLIILLQPTRVVSRKRIERNFRLIRSLFQRTRLKDEFKNNPNRQLILHITGPTPIEHQKDLEKVLYSYEKTIRVLPEAVADRIFLAFSAGHETHSSFADKQLEPLTIETIYRMADAVVFPSETEGRGLPIIEAAATGIPIICSHYLPREVFRDVVGDKLGEDLRIKYTLFPEGIFQRAFLSRVADLMLNNEFRQHVITHNKNAVRARFGQSPFQNKFKQMLIHLSNLG